MSTVSKQLQVCRTEYKVLKTIEIKNLSKDYLKCTKKRNKRMNDYGIFLVAKQTKYLVFYPLQIL